MKRSIGMAAVGAGVVFAALSVGVRREASGNDLSSSALSAKDAGAPAEPNALFAKDAGAPANPQCTGNAKDAGTTFTRGADLSGS
ncbi:MAG TPA: hypothetical protein VEK07_08950 [Polyangiaceae bacterium]|nr:hypothetical protein [Polyangiaceae bacterium]